MTRTTPIPAAGESGSPAGAIAPVPQTQWSPRVSAAMLARLAARAAVAAPAELLPVEAPFTGETLAEVPMGTPADVAAACAAARDGAGGVGAAPRSGARRGAHALPRPRDRQRRGDPRPHPARVRQGAHPRLRGGARRRHPGALLRAHGGGVPAAAPRTGRAPAPHGRARVHQAARRRRDHRPVELPAHPGDRRRPARAGRRQRRRAQARRPDAVHCALGGRASWRRRACPAACCRWSPGAAPSSAGRSSTAPTTSCSRAPPPPAAASPPSAASGSRTAPWSWAARTRCSSCRMRRCRRAVPGALQGITSNSGQLCVSIERIYVHDAVYDAFVPRLAEALRAVRLGVEPHVRRRHGLAG